mmetsp:Transcript_35640/g.52282  ORF Transcript_35640/g.52282 Transcript_35640/m.52282 type:complete len:127 (-) Transcript_35640:460-840(-)|eukprot:CAMPEP_0195523698 /NCGR_PEP_ID=MMETSP0794_2-20130614/23045_1 /TAXON_ID=515487 /ORGANISM="Stephanopyxis turris, Strain CCMP 815" /LENGTH=126 /DNA_ID=CAMNT_0040653753 /DNA_START=77 /DNA_END=457 /DNA_ORIENTATION=+
MISPPKLLTSRLKIISSAAALIYLTATRRTTDDIANADTITTESKDLASSTSSGPLEMIHDGTSSPSSYLPSSSSSWKAFEKSFKTNEIFVENPLLPWEISYWYFTRRMNLSKKKESKREVPPQKM